MFKFALVLCVATLVCGQTPTPAPYRPKQFRYVDDDESPNPKTTAQNQHQRQEAAPRHYVVPNAQPIPLQDYQPAEPVPPLVDVRTGADETGQGKKVGVGVNVGPFYSMDLKTAREPTLGQKALDLGLSVLGGLVRVNVQRDSDQFSRTRRGPILVQVGGHTVYSNGQK